MKTVYCIKHSDMRKTRCPDCTCNILDSMKDNFVDVDYDRFEVWFKDKFSKVDNPDILNSVSVFAASGWEAGSKLAISRIRQVSCSTATNYESFDDWFSQSYNELDNENSETIREIALGGWNAGFRLVAKDMKKKTLENKVSLSSGL